MTHKFKRLLAGMLTVFLVLQSFPLSAAAEISSSADEAPTASSQPTASDTEQGGSSLPRMSTEPAASAPASSGEESGEETASASSSNILAPSASSTTSAADAFGQAAVPQAQAEEQTSSGAQLRLTNLVVFVRFQGDTTDSLNEVPLPYAKPGRSVWTDIKERYNNTITQNSDSSYLCTVDDSFCAYIRAISDGKVEVSNLFPQEFTQDGLSKISYLDLSKTRAEIGDNDEAVISEVISAFNDNRLALPSGAVLDQNEAGVLDNLTIVLQGKSESDAHSLMRSHKSVSSTDQKIGGKYVRSYNMLCSESLIGSKAGVVAHEFLHTIGLPDLYRVSADGDPVGVWDIMSSTSLFLQYPLAYQRYTQGWISLPQATESGEYDLAAPLDGSGNQGLILRSPLSESEFFVVEYRKKNSNTSLRGFEQKIPKDGVIVYRVDTDLEELTNSTGKDYIYVFRDGETGLTDSYSPDKVSSGAALAAGETRGTADLNDTFAQRTIFYSDGSNSGIVVTAEGIQPDGSMRVSVQYPDYSSLALWDKLGGAAAGSAVYGNALATDNAGNLYAAYLEPKSNGDEMACGRVRLMRWNGSTWHDLGSPGDAYSTELSLACSGSDVYVSFAASNGNTVVSRYHSSWSKIYDATNGSYVCAQMASDASSLYLTFLSSDASILTLAKLNSAKTGFSALGTLRGSYFSTPALAVYGGKAVVVSNDFFAPSALTQVQAYDEASSQWQTLGSFAKAQSFRAAVSGDKLWVLRKPQEGNLALLACWNGSEWNSDISFNAESGFTEFSLSTYGSMPVIMAAPGNLCKVYTYQNGKFVQRGFDVRSAAEGCSMLVADSTIYTAVTGSGALNVYSKSAGTLSSEARLASLSLEGTTLSPAFSPNTYAYTATIEKPQAVLSAVAQDAGAVVDGSGTIPLAYGHNKISLTITAADGINTKNYTVDILRPEHPLRSFHLVAASASMQQGKTQILSFASVQPTNTTTDLSATAYTSSAPEILSIIGSGNDSVEVQALAAGSAVITAKSANNICATCKVTVYSLPAAARLSAGFLPAVPAIGLMNGEQTTLTLYAGGSAPVDAALFTFSSSNSALAQVDASGAVRANAEGKTGTVRITARLKGDPAKRSVSKDIRIIARQAASLQLTAAAVSSPACSEIDNDTNVINLDAADALAFSGGFRFTIHADSFDTDEQTPISVGIKWAISDSSLASLAVDKASGDALVTVKGRRAGACTITAKAADLSGKTASFALYVRDYVPRLESSGVTLNPQLSAGIKIALLPSYQNEITAVQLLVPVKEKGITLYVPARALTLTRVEDTDTWELNNRDASDPSAPTKLTDQTITAHLAISTEKETYTLPLKITVRNTLPAITIRQTEKFNLFYTDSAASITVSAKGADVMGASFASPTFSSTDGGATATVRYADTSVPANCYVSGKPVCKGTISVSLAGYNWPVTRTYTLATISAKPAVSLNTSSAVINTSSSMALRCTFALRDKATNTDLVLDQPAMLLKTTPVGFAAIATAGAQMTLNLTPQNGTYSAGTAIVSIQQKNWLTPISYTYTVRVTNKVPVAKVNSTLKVSSVFTQTDTYASAAVTLNQSNPMLDLQETELSAIRPNGNTSKLKVWYADGAVHAKVLDSTVANGTYAFRYLPALADHTLLAPVTVNVKVSNEAPAIRAKEALAINLACCNSEDHVATQPSDTVPILISDNRDALVVAAAKGNQAALLSSERISLAASDSSAAVRAEAEKLEVVYADGSVTATVSNASIRPGTYHYRLPARYRNGSSVQEKGSIGITVKVIRQTPSVKLSSTLLKLNRRLTGETAYASLASTDSHFSVASASFSPVSVSSGGAIAVRYAEGKICVSQTNTVQNATYTIHADVTLKENTTGQSVIVPLNFRVQIYAATPYVSLSSQGTANVLDRMGSQIVYTVKEQGNVSGLIVGAQLVGRDAALFRAVLGTNSKGQKTVAVTLQPGQEYSTAIAYQYAIAFTYSGISQTVTSTTLHPKVTQQTVKLTTSSAAGTVYQSNSARVYQPAITVASPGYAQIENITVSSASNPQLKAILRNFDASISTNSMGQSCANVQFGIADTSKLKVGNRYTLILDVTLRNAPINAKPLQIRYTLTVSP